MATLSNLNNLQVKGEATIRVIGEDGQIKSETTGKNLLNSRFWWGLLTSGNSNNPYSSKYHYNIRTYIGSEQTVPSPYETQAYMLGEGTDHPAGVFAVGAEPVTDYPYVQVRNLYQVTGSARTIYSIGLYGADSGTPSNDTAKWQDCVTRLLLPEPVVQGPNDQIDLVYRLYFEEPTNSDTHPAYWAYLVYWAITRTSSDLLGWDYQALAGCVLGMAGVGYVQPLRQATNIPTYAHSDANNYGGGHWLRTIDSQVFNSTQPTQTYWRSSEEAFYGYDTVFRTNKNYMWGELFNEWWPRDYGIKVYFAQWLGSQSGIIGNEIRRSYAYRLTKFHQDETTTTGPFHNSFNFNSTSPQLVYDIDNLPQTTWRAIFGGTWPADDRYPLYARLWWDESGAVDGSSAKYKLGFVRSLGTVNGQAYDEVYSVRGEGLKGSRNDGYSHQDRAFPGQANWSFYSDLSNGHHEYENSRFGNLGHHQGMGIRTQYNSQRSDFFAGQNYDGLFNVRKVVGLTTNTWWGWQSGKYGKSNHLGVEWRKLYPFERKVWQKEDISNSLNQIDWLEAVNGMPGEVDDEMCVITDSTSGVYLINASQDTVTQLTTLTGLDQCTVSRNPSDGTLIYTGIKYEEDEVRFFTSNNNWQEEDLLHPSGRRVGGTGTLGHTEYSGMFSHSPEGSSIYFQNGQWHPANTSSHVKSNVDKLQRNSFYFDGHQDSLIAKAPNNTFFDIGENDDFTLEAWADPNGITDDQEQRPIVKQGTVLLNSEASYCAKLGEYEITPGFFNEGDSTPKFYHFAVVRESGIVTVYKDGYIHATLVDENGDAIVDTNAYNTNDMSIGGQNYAANDSRVFKGNVQAARFTRAARYSGEFTPGDFTATDPANDPYWSDTLLSWSSEKQPLTVVQAGSNLVNGIHSNLATTGSATGSGLTVNVFCGGGNQITRVALESRGQGYRIGDVVTVNVPTIANPTFGEIQTLDNASLVGGSGYVDNTYTGVALTTSGSGVNVQATVVVTAGAVSSVTVDENNAGTGYAAGDQLFATDSDLGGSGNGAGFSIDVGTVDEQTNLDSSAIEIRIDSVATITEPWWANFGHQSYIIRRHWRHPDVLVGIFSNGANDHPYFIDLDSTFDPGYASLATHGYGYTGEFFGDQGEESSGITAVALNGDRHAEMREIAWSDFIQFEPNGLIARVSGTYQHFYSEHWNQKQCMIISTSHLEPATTYTKDDQTGSDPWTAPHSILQIANAEDSAYPHHIIGRRHNYNVHDWDKNRFTGYNPIIVKGGNRLTDLPEWQSRGSIATDLTISATAHANYAGLRNGNYPTPGSVFAAITDSTGTGVYKENGYERYKGLALDGANVNFCAPMWCGRDNEDVNTDSKYFPGAWPIDSVNDAVIPHPLRWDIYGWDSANSTWVREEWAYNYTEHRWEVDTDTVYPGRPAPNGGGTHSLSDIPQSPYNGLTVTFEDVRPEETNDPIQGEWSGQYIYNGCVMDGITEFTFATTVTNRPISIKTINTTIPSSGFIRVPEIYEDTFMFLYPKEHYFNLEIDGVSAEMGFSLNYVSDTVADGQVISKGHQLMFSQNDVGKTLTGTYPVVNFAAAEAPANWVWWTAERGESVDSTTTGLLGGNSYKDSATLVSEGWTTVRDDDPVNVRVNASSFSTEFPDGFAYMRQNNPYVTEGHYAECIYICRDVIGFFWDDGTTSPSQNNYHIDNSSDNNPAYGGISFMYDDSHRIVSVHTQTYTDPSGDNWLVIRGTWRHLSYSEKYIVAEQWISVDDPFTYEVRIGQWDSDIFAEYIHGTHYGIAYTYKYAFETATTDMTFKPPCRKPYGASGIHTYTGDPRSYSPWGGDYRTEYPNSRYTFNFDPHDFEEPT